METKMSVCFSSSYFSLLKRRDRKKIYKQNRVIVQNSSSEEEEERTPFRNASLCRSIILHLIGRIHFETNSLKRITWHDRIFYFFFNSLFYYYYHYGINRLYQFDIKWRLCYLEMHHSIKPMMKAVDNNSWVKKKVNNSTKPKQFDLADFKNTANQSRSANICLLLMKTIGDGHRLKSAFHLSERRRNKI